MGEFDDCDTIDEAASEKRWVLDLQDRLAAAEQRAVVAEAALRQAQEDARLLGSLYYADDGGAFLALRESAALTDAEVDALGEIEAGLFDTPDEQVVAALRRVLRAAPHG